MLKRCMILTILLAYGGALLPTDVWARRLPPADFEQMYSLASGGNLASLLAAENRGLDLDAVNSNGDTGVCAAIRRNDYLAYNTFIKAGAQSKPGCIFDISTAKYENFINSPNTIKYSQYPASWEPRENNDWVIVGVAASFVYGLYWLVSAATK